MLLLGDPAADAFTMSVRPASNDKASRGLQRKDFVKQVVGASAVAAAGAASSPLASVAAAREYQHLARRCGPTADYDLA